MISEIFAILVFEILIFTFAVLFEVFPGNKYKVHKHEIQLLNAIIMMVTATIIVTISKVFPEALIEKNILLQTDVILPFWGIFGIIFLCSVYKYLDVKKNSGNICLFELKKYEYKLQTKFDLTIGDYVYMPNVSCVADCGSFIIVFSTVRPATEVDAFFICKQIKDNQFECITFKEDVSEFHIRKVMASIGTWMMLLLSMIESVLMILIGHRFVDKEINMVIQRLSGFIGLMILGLLCIILFKNVQGVIKYLFVTFGVVILILSCVRLFSVW
ncbi:hypothetical protein SAMN02910298_01941 [Pseudobutyrivibrio sp. YE44]|uniref:hypothetical protein n=1 Tax=Pseudobutyrivibrio sp. YE44 TaxID=1520802 RepID=UPI000886FCFA|nr:hypothetical protein [Pseudobutyrivibrio sp. YE44]SDB39868.1 hypothetical protein SAMN02910298_01941 [Pseudobutyrivibrio sp. YE44]